MTSLSVSTCLSGIESEATWLRHHAAALSGRIGLLSVRRSFETRAQGELDAAERELIAALAKVREAKQSYAAKQIDDKAA
jgi:hypothetical protein